MTYDQCVAIIGAENQMARGYAAQRNAILGGQARGTQTLDESYPWSNPGGYYAEIAFHNGRVTGKAWKKGPAGHAGLERAGGTASGSGGGNVRK